MNRLVSLAVSEMEMAVLLVNTHDLMKVVGNFISDIVATCEKVRHSVSSRILLALL